MPTIYVENKPYEIRDGLNLLHACLELGFNLPYFCWHPAMHSVGACRQCAVKVFRNEQDTKGALAMACMTAAKDGTRLSIEDPEARAFRKSITEWLMINHPHDCPVCDEGGECHLQDMVVMTGHTYRRYRGRKRTFRNQNLGPFVNHEMNRCIQCYRCVRFYRDVAGGRDLDAFLSHHLVYFGRHADGVLESEFSGNLVEICPTGVFTDKTLGHHYTRKWDLQSAPSVCAHCSIGCNTIPGERYRILRRVMNRYHGEVNGYFLCDRGRFGYEFVNSSLRLSEPLLRGREDASVIPAPSLRETVAGFLKGKRMIGIGSPRSSVEANFALRALVGADHFYSGVSSREHALTRRVIDLLKKGPARIPTLREMAAADAALILGEDVTQTGPLAALFLRQSVRTAPMEIARRLRIPEWDDKAVRDALQGAKGPFYVASIMSTRLDDIATRVIRAAPADLARLGFAVAHEIDQSGPAPEGLSDEFRAASRDIASALGRARRPLIISGIGSGSLGVVEAAAGIARSLAVKNPDARLAFILPECNSMGLALMDGKSLEDAISAIQAGRIDTAVILENDLFRRLPPPAVDAFLKIKTIVLDCIATDTALKADLALPVGSFAESDGTLVNYEGRAQRFYKVCEQSVLVEESWRRLRDLAILCGKAEAASWKTLDDLVGTVARSLPVFEKIVRAAPPESFRITGMKIARQTHRFSGRTAMSANVTVHEPPPQPDPDSPLSFSMEGHEGEAPPALIPRFWAPGWNSVQSLNKFQEEIGGKLRGGDPGVRLLEPSGRGETGPDRPAPSGEGILNMIRSLTPQQAARNALTAGFRATPGKLLLVCRHHIFGSEELSALSPSVAQLAPAPYIALNPRDDDRLAKNAEGLVEFTLSGASYRLPVRRSASLPEGVAAVPAGISSLQWAAGEMIQVKLK